MVVGGQHLLLLLGVGGRSMPRRARRREDGRRGATKGSSKGHGGRASVGRRRASVVWPLLDTCHRRGTMHEAALTAPCTPTVPGGGFDAFPTERARLAPGAPTREKRQPGIRAVYEGPTGNLQEGLQGPRGGLQKWPPDRQEMAT